jgi:septal ring factor EnvC (AmiA/AmiB activator)
MITLNGIRNAAWCLLAFGIVACASSPMPVEKLAVAKSSIQRAEQAQAAQYAQVELNSARNKLRDAEAAVDEKDAEVASRLADQADIDAQLAESTARAKRQEQLADQMDAGLRDLQHEAERSSGATAVTPQPQVSPQVPVTPQQ